MFSKSSRTGFTLIEILIVVAIIGILAGVVLVGLRGTGPQARDSRRAADLRQVQNGLELYYNKLGAYPATQNWAALKTALVNADVGIKNIPQDPKTGATYEYAATGALVGSPDTYVLKAVLEQPASKLLENDIDGNPVFAGGPDCEDASLYYCVQL
jgi:general secretion pathway protein G